MKNSARWLAAQRTSKKIYEYAVNDRPYSFLWCNFRSADPRKIFMLRFEKYLNIEDIA